MLEVKTIDKPDERRDFPLGHLEALHLTGLDFAVGTFEPGWRWSESLRPLVATDSCEVHHNGFVVQGRMRIKMDDGAEFDCKPGDVSLLPSGHDAWTVGNEPAVVVDFQGMLDYASGK